MRKIHVLTTKEEINEEKVQSCSVVIIDVLLATSTISAALSYGFKEVIPVKNEAEAKRVSQKLPENSYILAGESKGYTIRDFVNPDPLALMKQEHVGKSLILSTTNGTVAIRKSLQAKRLYTSSLLNGRATAEALSKQKGQETVLIVAAGSMGSFAFEDFIGAGHLIAKLLEKESYVLTDASKAAIHVYRSSQNHYHNLLNSATGRFLREVGYAHAIEYISKVDILDVAPVLIKNSNGLLRLSNAHLGE